MRLTDTDLTAHACRIYLNGTNHPYSSRGGQWCLGKEPPTTLRPTVDKEEYERFTAKINEIVRWPILGWETLLFLLFCIIFPPLAPEILSRLRKRRGFRLLQFIESYDHSCFRLEPQRTLRDSVRYRD